MLNFQYIILITIFLSHYILQILQIRKNRAGLALWANTSHTTVSLRIMSGKLFKNKFYLYRIELKAKLIK